MNLTDLLTERLISADLKADGKLAVLDELAHLIGRVHEDVNPELVARALLDRERIMSTAVGHGVAIPHAKTSAVDQIVGCLGLHRAGIDFDAEDGSRTHIFFTLLAPEDSSGENLKVLARISRLCQDQAFRKTLREAESSHAILNLIKEAEKGI
jgi:mannitol/fructose-specific phosphotransferase system IIA component (Ntr-type)